MTTAVSALAGKLAPRSILIDVPLLIAAYYEVTPDMAIPAQRVIFGTSGHRGNAHNGSFNEAHILAICQAICDYRAKQRITGPLYLGIDTHALSVPAMHSAMEVLAANGVTVMLADPGDFTPTPALSFAILDHNRRRTHRLADGIVITPSHNPPADGGLKYNLPHGGPASSAATGWIERRANQLLEGGLHDVRRLPFFEAMAADTSHLHDFMTPYVRELGQVVDMRAIRDASLLIGVDPMGGAGIHYWDRIAEFHGLQLTLLNRQVDPTFGFMTVDWDGAIRMDPSSVYAMQNLVGQRDRFDIAFACDADYDRHGIVTPAAGLLPSNHFLVAAVAYLFEHRSRWGAQLNVGKSVVTTSMIDVVAHQFGRHVVDMPVGFKWFAEGLLAQTLGFAGEESAGGSFLRMDGSVWTTEKDGLTCALLAAEITAVTGMDPGFLYQRQTRKFGTPMEARVQLRATSEQRKRLLEFDADELIDRTVAGEKIVTVMTRAPGNNVTMGGFKVVLDGAWFAARPSGTEDMVKIYVETFKGNPHLKALLQEAMHIVRDAITAPEHAAI